MNGDTLSDTLLEQWLLEIRSLALVTEGSAAKHAGKNMLVFPASELQNHGIDTRSISDFLLKAYLEYQKRAEAHEATGWFYAWYDEMSGTLRCSMAATESVNGLPFRCRLCIVDSPDAIAHALVESEYAHGIPFDELVPVPFKEWDEDEERASGEYCLTVFARRVESSPAPPRKPD